MRSKKILQGIEQTNFTRSSSRQKDTTRMTTKTIFFRSYVPTKVKNTATRLGDTFQMKDVHSRHWGFLKNDGIIFCESQREEDYSTVKQNSGYSDRQWHCGLRHASEGLHRGAWRSSVGTFGERFSVFTIVGKTKQ